MEKQRQRRWLLLLLLLIGTALLAACAGEEEEDPVVPLDTSEEETEAEVGGEVLSLPELEATEFEGERLEVAATTGVVGDVVANVGGDAIDLAVLVRPQQDPHSFQPAAGDLAAVGDAAVIFVNGWTLEEGILGSLENVAEYGPLVPISAGIEPHMEDGSVDAHVWLDPNNVMQWTRNVAEVLSTLDPANAELYEENAAIYLEQLQDLDDFIRAQVATIPESERLLVTNHDALAYFADRYGFEVVGTVIPGTSTAAEPSASGMAELAETMTAEEVCTIFIEGTADASLAEAVAEEVDGCDEVEVLELYVGTLGPEGSPPGTYIGMMRTNMAVIVEGLAD